MTTPNDPGRPSGPTVPSDPAGAPAAADPAADPAATGTAGLSAAARPAVLLLARAPRRLAFWTAGATIATAAVTFAAPGLLRGVTAMNGSLLGTTAVMVIVAVPLLLAAVARAGRPDAAGRRAIDPRAFAVWAGAAVHLVYNGVLVLLATPLSRLFLAQTAVAGLAIWHLVVLLTAVDRSSLLAAHTAPAERRGARAVAVGIGVVVVLNALAWLRGPLTVLAGGSATTVLAGLGLTTHPLWAEDLTVWLPAMGLGALWLWRRRAVGAAICSAGLVFWTVEGIGVATDQVWAHTLDPASPVASSLMAPPFLALSLVCALTWRWWWRAP